MFNMITSITLSPSESDLRSKLEVANPNTTPVIDSLEVAESVSAARQEHT
jgi:hypothetical protein